MVDVTRRASAAIIAFYARKGGVGKSTTAFEFACYAANLGRKVLLCSMDPQGDSVYWAARGERALSIDDPFESDFGFKAIWSPDQLPDPTEHGCELMIVDLPPATDAVFLVRPTIWVIPVDGRTAFTDTMMAIPDMRAQGGKIAWVLNKSNAGGETVSRQLRDAASKIPNSIVLDVIPFSPAVARVAEYLLPTFQVPYNKGTQGTEAMRRFCAALLQLVPAAPVVPIRPALRGKSVPDVGTPKKEKKVRGA